MSDVMRSTTRRCCVAFACVRRGARRSTGSFLQTGGIDAAASVSEATGRLCKGAARSTWILLRRFAARTAAAHAREIGGRLIQREPVDADSSGPANPGPRRAPSHRAPSIDQYP